MDQISYLYFLIVQHIMDFSQANNQTKLFEKSKFAG